MKGDISIIEIHIDISPSNDTANIYHDRKDSKLPILLNVTL